MLRAALDHTTDQNVENHSLVEEQFWAGVVADFLKKCTESVTADSPIQDMPRGVIQVLAGGLISDFHRVAQVLRHFSKIGPEAYTSAKLQIG